MCILHGSKDISLCQQMKMLETDKVGAGTFGHPVEGTGERCTRNWKLPWIENLTHTVDISNLMTGGYFDILGKNGREVYEFNNSAASCSRSSFYALYESHVCPLSFVVW